MRYRKLSPSGDYTFGNQQNDFYIDNPEAVAQAIRTRLRLALKDWWLDQTEGTPWFERIYGKTPILQRNAEIQARILQTQGMVSIDSFSSFDSPERLYTFTCVVTTQYSAEALKLTESFNVGFN